MSESASTAITLTLWNKWVPVRRETTADGMTSVYFGIGRLSWVKNGRSDDDA